MIRCLHEQKIMYFVPSLQLSRKNQWSVVGCKIAIYFFDTTRPGTPWVH